MMKPATSKAWQLQDAKARFSELFRLAHSRGPQRVTRHGKEAVVVVAEDEYERLRKKTIRSRSTLAEFFRQSPLVGADIDLEREPDFGRDNLL